MKATVHFWSYLAQFFLGWEIFQTKVIEKMKTHGLYSVIFYRKSYRLWESVEKYGIPGRATHNNNEVHAHCVLDN
jgi:hypothetical protein